MYAIEQNVPPPGFAPVKGNKKYPLLDMKRNDSFVIPAAEVDCAARVRQAIHISANRYRKVCGVPTLKVATKTQPDGSLRVWRLDGDVRSTQPKRAIGANRLYPFHTMKLRETFVRGLSWGETYEEVANSIRVCASYYRKAHDPNFRIETTRVNEGVRVRRTA